VKCLLSSLIAGSDAPLIASGGFGQSTGSGAKGVRQIVRMLTHLHGHRLDEWIAAAQNSSPSPIARFATGLTHDLAGPEPAP